jgi:hypothetical protein
MPRKSIASLIVVPFKTTPAKSKFAPTAPLNKAEKALWVASVNSHGHLRPADAACLTAFCQAMCNVYALAKKKDATSIASFEKVSRIAAMWATKLRITTQSQVLPDMAGRKRNQQSSSYYDQDHGDDD